MKTLALFFMFASAVFGSMPRVIECASQTDAQYRAAAYVVALGLEQMTKDDTTLSMAPQVGAHAIFLCYRDYAGIRHGDLVIRRDQARNVAHEAIARIGDEWVMKGAANAYADCWRLTAGNYGGTVATVLNFPL